MLRVEVGGRAYAIGLWWQMVEKRQEAKKEALQTNEAFGNSFTRCVLLEKQYGLASAAPKTLGLPSLAQAIARTKKPALFYTHFSREGVFWVCAVKDGLVAADGDAVFFHEEDAQRALNDLAETLSLTSSGLIQDISYFLPQKTRSGRLLDRLFPKATVRHLFSPWKKLRRIGLVLLILLLAILFKSIDFFHDSSDINLVLEARKKEIMAHPERFFPRPWLEAPSPKTFAQGCLREMFTAPTSDLGWDLEDMLCNGKTVTSHWKFSSAASFLHIPEGATLLTPERAEKVVTLAPLEKEDNRALITKDEVSRTMYELARILGLHLRLNWKEKAKRDVREANFVVPLVCPWFSADFTISPLPAMTVADKNLYEALSAIPGLLLTTLTVNNTTWELTGLCHGL